MNDFILFMYDDAPDRALANDDTRWEAYFSQLHTSGRFDGGSAIGAGRTFRKGRVAHDSSAGPTGFIRVRAADIAEAQAFLVGNPVYEAGGTVEIRALPRDG